MTRYHNCAGISRRNCIQVGLGGFLSMGLAEGLRAGEAGAGSAKTREADACILVWQDGGPTHYETFDPKPDAPVEIRGEFESIPTKLPGVRFSAAYEATGRDRGQALDRAFHPT